MLLGTFKTVFNSVFLVGTKNKTPHHMAKVERRTILERGRKTREEIERRRMYFSLHQQSFTIWCPFLDTRHGLDQLSPGRLMLTGQSLVSFPFVVDRPINLTKLSLGLLKCSSDTHGSQMTFYMIISE